MSQKFNQNRRSNEVLPTEKKQPSVIAAQAQYRGPIPPASEFAAYGRVIPDAPERILKVFEEDSAHVRQMQNNALAAEVARDKRGQWMAFIIIIATIILTGVCIYLNQAVAAVLSGITSLVLVFKGVFGPRGVGQQSTQNKAGSV